MSLTDFLEQISTAQYVYFDSETELFYEWNGSQTVNIWTCNSLESQPWFENTDIFMAPFESVDEVKRAISARIAGKEDE